MTQEAASRIQSADAKANKEKVSTECFGTIYTHCRKGFHHSHNCTNWYYLKLTIVMETS